MGNDKTNAEKFFECFIEKIKAIENKPDIKKDYSALRLWTQTMLGNTPKRSKKKRPEDIENAGGVIGQTIKSVFDNKIFIDKEYYKIDMIGWKQHNEEIKSACEKINFKPYCWSLEVAVEHENGRKEWLDEVCKLSFIKCPLRVVIGYGIDNFNDKIKIASDILEMNNALSDDNQEFLIILGKTKKELSKNPTANEIAEGYNYAIITKKGVIK